MAFYKALTTDYLDINRELNNHFSHVLRLYPFLNIRIQTPPCIHVFSQCFLVNKSAFRYIVLFSNCMDLDVQTIIVHLKYIFDGITT